VKKPVSKFAFQIQPAVLHSGGAGSPPPAGRPQQRRVKSQGEVWASALMKIDGCAEGSALAIVRAHPTMVGRCRLKLLNSFDP
jgi:hypothetical protein